MVDVDFIHSQVAATVGQQDMTPSYLVKLARINLVTSSYIII